MLLSSVPRGWLLRRSGWPGGMSGKEGWELEGWVPALGSRAPQFQPPELSMALCLLLLAFRGGPLLLRCSGAGMGKAERRGSC